MSKTPRITRKKVNDIIDSIKTEADVAIVQNDAEKSIKALSERFQKAYEKDLSLMESTIEKTMANAEVRLTRGGKALTREYNNYLQKALDIRQDILNANSKAEIASIKDTISVYRGIVKNTKNLSKEEKKEVQKILKETTNTANLVRKSKLSNSRMFVDSIKNNLPDIAGVITSVFGDSLIPAFIGGVVGDYTRAKKQAQEEQRAKQQQLIRDERDASIRKSVELRQQRKEDSFSARFDTNRLKTNRGFFAKRFNPIPGMSPLGSFINSGVLKGLSNLPKLKEKKVERLTGQEIAVEAKNKQEILKRVEQPELEIKPKKENKNTKPLDKAVLIDTLIQFADSSELASTLEDSVYTGVFEAMSDLSSKEILGSPKKEKQRQIAQQRIEERKNKLEKVVDRKEKDTVNKKVIKEQEERDQKQIELLEKSQQNTEELASIESTRRWKAVLNFIANKQKRIPGWLRAPFDAISVLAKKSGKNEEARILGKLGKTIEKKAEGFFENKYVKGVLNIFKTEEENYLAKIADILDELSEFLKNIYESQVNSTITTDLIKYGEKQTDPITEYLKSIDSSLKGRLTTIPFNYGTLTPYEVDIRDTLKAIEDYNAEEYNATGFLIDYMKSCFPCKKEDDTYSFAPENLPILITESPYDKEREKRDKIKNIFEEEKEKDRIQRWDRLQTSVDNIYDILDERLGKYGEKEEDTGGIISDALQLVFDGKGGILSKIKTAIISGFESVFGGGIFQALKKGGIKGFFKGAGKGLFKAAKDVVKGGVKAGKGILGIGEKTALKSAGKVLGTSIAKDSMKLGLKGVVGGGLSAAGGALAMDMLMPDSTVSGKQELNALKQSLATGDWKSIQKQYAVPDLLNTPEQNRKINRINDIQELGNELKDSESEKNASIMSSAVQQITNISNIGGTTQNITMPIYASDSDSGTNALVHSYGS